MRNLALSLSVLILTLGGAEIALRGVYPDGVHTNIENIEVFKWVTGDAVKGWKNKRAFELGNLKINQLGLRGPETTTEKDEGTLRILCLGDSRTFGIWNTKSPLASFTSHYPGELRQLLQQYSEEQEPPTKIEVLNLGVIGYSSAHVLRQLNTEVASFEPDIVTVAVGFNDMTLSWDSGMRMQEPDSELLRSALYSLHNLRLVQLVLRANQLRPWKPEKFTAYWASPEEYRTNLHRIVESTNGLNIPLLFIHQPLRALALGEASTRENATDNGMKILYYLADAKDLSVVHQRFNEYRDILFHVAQEAQVPLLNIEDAFRNKDHLVFGDYDLVHYNPTGARIVAEEIRAVLLQESWLAQ